MREYADIASRAPDVANERWRRSQKRKEPPSSSRRLLQYRSVGFKSALSLLLPEAAWFAGNSLQNHGSGHVR